MGPIQDIRDGAVDGSSALAQGLRRCATLAHRLNQPLFGDWVKREPNGYPSKKDRSGYRIVRGAPGATSTPGLGA